MTAREAKNGARRQARLSTLQDTLQQSRLRPRHFLRERGRGVVVTGQVKQAMERVEQDFVPDFETIFPGAILSHGRADEDFAVGKSDDIGLGWITEEIAMHAGHGGAVDEHEVNRGEMSRQGARQKRQR